MTVHTVAWEDRGREAPAYPINQDRLMLKYL